MFCSVCGSPLAPGVTNCPICHGANPLGTSQFVRRQASEGGGKAMASFILGLASLVAWCIPLFGLPVSIAGLVYGVKSLQSNRRGIAIAGLVLSIVGLVASIANMAIGAYLGATGQHPLFPRSTGP